MVALFRHRPSRGSHAGSDNLRQALNWYSYYAKALLFADTAFRRLIDTSMRRSIRGRADFLVAFVCKNIEKWAIQKTELTDWGTVGNLISRVT